MITAVPVMRELGRKVRNWGRWGADDERGTTNLITPGRVAAAAGLVRTGEVFDLGIPLDGDGPQPGGYRINPIRLMSETGHEQVLPGGFRWADDYVFMPLQAGSQYDSLAHVHYDEQLYNGHPASGLNVKGADKCGIHTQAKGIAGRGVLLDVARFRGVEWLDLGSVIGPDELDMVAAAQGVEVGPGDILLIRTDWRAKFLADHDAAGFMAGEPGLGLACASWLRERDVAVVGSDNFGVEVMPGENAGAMFELHMVLIRDMGMTLAEMLDLEQLAAACAADGAYDFFYTGAPLKFTRGVGSPINPLAIR
ncbi:cyclase family protein [Rhodococcus opacus]|uniref:Cyclase family protein n=1 Tax=Rhodococcus opacus TaxID=37919 RepID=A0AAX3Y7T5_RHOOP|nr:cyclase family protein [Rhodococcus opacus]MCZ4590040.1 cyclase family protein [Rhodococcus opacus]WLF44564.1 cyclase family protein [Rhodococcus opacus]